MGPSRIALRLSLLPACPSRGQVCVHPSCSPRQHGIPRSKSGPPARWSTAMRAANVALLHGSSLRFGLCCPKPSTLNRPDPPHSWAQPNFIARRLIWAAFAVRERLGDPRVVPRFRLSIFPSMSSSTSPGSRPLHASSSFTVRICLRRGVIGSALPMLAISGLTGSPLLRPAGLLASLTGDFYFRAFNGSVTLPVAGYDYGGNWTISTGGTHTR
jgi:hypothetical protein